MARLTSRGNRCSVPTSATMASRVSRTEKTVSAAATRMSHAVIRSTPAPMHQPWVTAITGCGQSATAVKVRCIRFTIDWVPRRSATLDPPPPRVGPKAARSSPTVKAEPFAAMTIALVSGSDAGGFHCGGELVPERQHHRVAPLRVVEPDHGDMPAALDVDDTHGGQPSRRRGRPNGRLEGAPSGTAFRPSPRRPDGESSSGVSMLRQERPSSPTVATWPGRSPSSPPGRGGVAAMDWGRRPRGVLARDRRRAGTRRRWSAERRRPGQRLRRARRAAGGAWPAPPSAGRWPPAAGPGPAGAGMRRAARRPAPPAPAGREGRRLRRRGGRRPRPGRRRPRRAAPITWSIIGRPATSMPGLSTPIRELDPRRGPPPPWAPARQRGQAP